MTIDVRVRFASSADASRLAELKIEWKAPNRPPTAEERTAYASALATWMSDRSDSTVCAVAESGRELLGMAWMVFYERVPDLDDSHRLTADVQSAYVRAEYRRLGTGGLLIDALCTEADRRGARMTSVHSSTGAIPFYRRQGFANSERMLIREQVES